MKKIITTGIFLLSNIANACNLSGSIDTGADYERNEHTVFNMTINSICSETDTDFNLLLINGTSNNSQFRYFTNTEGLVAGIENTNLLKYFVYTDITQSNIFGDGSNGTKKVFFNASTEMISKNFVLVVPQEQPVRPGSYSDTLEFDIEY